MRWRAGPPSAARIARELAGPGLVIAGRLARDRVEALRAVVASTAGADDDGLAIDYTRVDRRAMHRLWEVAVPLLEPALADRLPGRRPVMATVVTKHPGPASTMFVHDDRTYVPPGHPPSITAWIPLVDVDARTGGRLRVLSGSHRLTSNLSGTATPDVIRPYEAQVLAALEPLDTPAGTVVLYDSRLLHASEPNVGTQPRPAIVSTWVRADDPSIHVVATGRRRRRLLEVDPSFYREVHPAEVAAWAVEREAWAELDDPPALDRGLLRALVGLEPDPRTVVPPDVGVGPELEVVDTPSADRGADVAADAVVTVAGPDGSCVAVEPWGAVERWLPPGAEAAGVQVVTVGAGDRAGVRASRPSVLVTLEGPAVAAGVRSPAGVAQLDLGRAPVVEGDLTLWNDGPGPLVVLLAGWASPR